MLYEVITDAEALVELYRRARPAAKPADLLFAIETDRIFRIPAIRLAEARAQHPGPTFMYRFDWESPALGGALGACHAVEIPFVFGALGAPGAEFFAVETPYGERYTRNGNFTVGVEGYLETKEGYPVLGENGRLFLQGQKFTVNKNGEVWVRPVSNTDADPILLDRMKLVNFENDRYLSKQGSSLYKDTPVSGPALPAEGSSRPRIQQGFVEASRITSYNVCYTKLLRRRRGP